MYKHNLRSQFKIIAEKNNFKIAYKPMNTLNRFMKLDED